MLEVAEAAEHSALDQKQRQGAHENRANAKANRD
jgi:hypothetical protein